MYREGPSGIEVLLAHPGGPFWAKRDAGAWSIPKGEIAEGEEPFARACIEFEEETGFRAAGPFLPLGSVRQPGGKHVEAWAFAGDCDPRQARSNTFRVEWPRGSGRWRTYPEVDAVAWFDLALARTKLLKGQVPLLDRLVERLAAAAREPAPR
jgi:predicted NUDIX family NTP pyrophosphohydrolase